MRALQFKLIALVFVVPVLLFLALDLWGRNNYGWPETIGFFSVYATPFIADICILYVAPAFQRMLSVEKMICITCLSIAGTMTGTVVILVLWVLLSAVTGGPFRR